MKVEAKDKHYDKEKERMKISYMLNVLGFLGFTGGLHRLYNGKVATGLLWMFTLGLFGLGQFVDLFLIPNMVEEREIKLRLKAGLSPFGVAQNPQAIASEIYQSPQETLMVELLKAAENRGGKLSVTQGVLDTGAKFSQVEATLQEMHKSGYVGIGNNPENGAVTYIFHELT
ncbi:putative membrane protein [Rivularia sp. PCC 7116]|uniref:NINE protein n=1 Tax=Rivularia sp. PCC 7116 TaxID=373994 RepID=UPI00029F49D6|nr:NINE protein [Rivularia sp. PCC 7116]AFY56054.1 putative membrane protein [Rivularia sp. PCC 7116]